MLVQRAQGGIVLKTAAQYEAEKRDRDTSSIPLKNNLRAVAPHGGPGVEKKGPVEIYFLVHPERPISSGMFWESIMNINKTDYRVECVDGTVRTTESEVMTYLVKQGWILEKTIMED